MPNVAVQANQIEQRWRLPKSALACRGLIYDCPGRAPALGIRGWRLATVRRVRPCLLVIALPGGQHSGRLPQQGRTEDRRLTPAPAIAAGSATQTGTKHAGAGAEMRPSRTWRRRVCSRIGKNRAASSRTQEPGSFVSATIRPSSNSLGMLNLGKARRRWPDAYGATMGESRCAAIASVQRPALRQC
jgi:hypothetical protein